MKKNRIDLSCLSCYCQKHRYTFSMKKFLIFILWLCAFLPNLAVSAASIPFTDVSVSSPYYSAIETLFRGRIISDDGSGLFRPDDTVNRDAFVGLSVSVSCKQCLTPTMDDIVQYSISPFVDLTKQNPYYYCIAYAADKKITQWYTLDTRGQGICQDGWVFQKSPFCEKNKTTRIEAIAMLLRQANLWNDTLNQTLSKTTDIRDVTDYWYGYARKGVQAGMISLRADSTIGQDEYITRGEFANMAAKMLTYNQCVQGSVNNTLSSAIRIVGSDDRVQNKSLFSKDDIFRLIPILSGDIGKYRYTWKAVDSVTRKIVSGTDPALPSSALGAGSWYIELSVIDISSGEILSTPTTTITISNGSTLRDTTTPIGNGADTKKNIGINGSLFPNITLSSSALKIDVWGKIDFSTYAIGTGPIAYAWDFWDGSRTTSSRDTWESHVYDTPGIYTVTVTMTDASGKTAQSSLIVEIAWDTDTDKDSVVDIYDACPLISGPRENKWCPLLETNPYTKGTDILSSSVIPREENTANRNNSLPIINSDIRTSSTIAVVDAAWAILSKSTFGSGEYFSLISVTGIRWSYSYAWKAVDSISGKIITGTDTSLLGSLLSTGNWYVTLTTSDRDAGAVISTASTTVTIGDGGSISDASLVGGWLGSGPLDDNRIWNIPYPSLTLKASALEVWVGDMIYFSTLAYWAWSFTYSWDLGDGTRISPPKWSLWAGNIEHIYREPGVYRVIVALTDATGKTVQATMTVKVASVSSNLGSAIKVVWSDGTTLPSSIFERDTVFSLVPSLSVPWDYSYTWTAIDSTTGRVVTGIGRSLESTSLSVGNYSVLLTIRDTITSRVVGTPSLAIAIMDSTTTSSAIPTAILSASTLSTDTTGSIDFSSRVSGTWPLTSSWNFGDGSPTVIGASPQSHTFASPGTYRVTLTVKDTKGNSVISSVIVSIGSIDTDKDGTVDSTDACPKVVWPIGNRWCPLVSLLLGSLEKNNCLANKARAQWLIIASPVCDQCPCTNSVAFSALARSCDVLFPTILSWDRATIYSRGGLYQIP